jgi:ATP-binding protein involved in chromosome partitioning
MPGPDPVPSADRTRPLVITKSDPSRLSIEWADGHRSEFSARRLRDLCPCARCVDELTGRPIHDPASTAADIETARVALVGHYALTIGFTDGHSTGIYPFVMLRERG